MSAFDTTTYANIAAKLYAKELEAFLIRHNADPDKHVLGQYIGRPETRYLLPKGVAVAERDADDYPSITITFTP